MSCLWPDGRRSRVLLPVRSDLHRVPPSRPLYVVELEAHQFCRRQDAHASCARHMRLLSSWGGSEKDLNIANIDESPTRGRHHHAYE